VLDFDGVMTDGTVFTDQNGIESVRCSRRDGLGVELLKRHGIRVHVVSKEPNPVVSARCKKLDVPYDQGIHDGDGKVDVLKRVTAEAGLSREQVAYMGDDLNDVPALQWAGASFAPADAHPNVVGIANYVTHVSGGRGAVREIAELILYAQGVELSKF